MLRKNIFAGFAALALMVSLSIVASAQTGQLRGHVVMKDTGGNLAPVAGATIDVFRTDIAGKYSTKTDKKGQFVFAGLPYVGKYILSVSAPNAQPYAVSGVLAGRDNDYAVELLPGDGRRFTAEEALSVTAASAPAGGAGGATETAEERKKREAALAENARIEAQNKKNQNINEIVGRTYKAGNAAYQAKNYDEAIRQYDEGLTADPEQSALLTNKTFALTQRGEERYNAGARAADPAAKTTGIEAAKQDFRDAATTSAKAVEIAEKEYAAAAPADQPRLDMNRLVALTARAKAMRRFVSLVDQSQTDAGIKAYEAYIAAEKDPAKKKSAQLEEAQMLLDAGAADKALAMFQQILASDPDNIDATLGAGLALFQSGDKAKFQEAANYLQRFVDKAPDNHKLKPSAKEALDYLKNEQNIKPQRGTTTTGRRRG